MSADEQRKIVKAALADGVLRESLSHPVGAPPWQRWHTPPPALLSPDAFEAALKEAVLGAQDKKHGASESPFYGWLFAGKVPRRNCHAKKLRQADRRRCNDVAPRPRRCSAPTKARRVSPSSFVHASIPRASSQSHKAARSRP